MRAPTADAFQQLLDAVAKKASPLPAPSRSECSTCKHVVGPFYRRCPQCEGNRNRETVDTMRDEIRKLKQSPPRGDDAQRIAIKRLVFLGHPYPREAVEAIAAIASSPSSGRARGGL